MIKRIKCKRHWQIPKMVDHQCASIDLFCFCHILYFWKCWMTVQTCDVTKQKSFHKLCKRMQSNKIWCVLHKICMRQNILKFNQDRIWKQTICLKQVREKTPTKINAYECPLCENLHDNQQIGQINWIV